MEKKELNEKIRELTLMLLYLTSWEENEMGMQYRRSWKGYDSEILDQLYDDDFVRGGHRSKSVILTDAGMQKAKEILNKYSIEEES